MKTVGLITEYNPFHNGHQYHIEQAKKLSNASFVVVVMSGNFVQRGIPAITDKFTRAEIALKCGADFVFELPAYYAVSSAEQFAYGSVALLHQLGFIDSICFGGEYNDLTNLKLIADLLIQEPSSYKETLTNALKNGASFPAARQQALLSYLPDKTLLPLLSSPNSILGIEYLKALSQLNSSIKPFIVKRKGAGYSDEVLSDTIFSSATSIRKHINEEKAFHTLSDTMPKEAFSLLQQKQYKTFPIFSDDFSSLLYYKLRCTTKEQLLDYLDLSEELADRIINNLIHYKTFEQFASLLKTKQYTRTRINRCFIHVLLDIKKKPYTYKYARLLGFKKSASFLLKKTDKEIFPIITKPADAKHLLTEDCYKGFCQDIACTDIYNHIAFEKFHTTIPNDYKHPLVILS